ncbi:MAG: glycosyltransferase [Patescibacteria group bacterium]
MRIAIFSDNFYPEISGIADSIIRTGRELIGRGHTIAFFAPRYSEKNFRAIGRSPHEIDLGPKGTVVRLASLSFPGATGQGRVVIPLGALRRKAIRSFCPDIIHVNLPFGVGLEGLWAARALGVPLVGTDHTPMAQFAHYSPIKAKWVERALVRYNAWFYGQCHYLTSPAKVILEELSRQGVTSPRQSLSNPIDTVAFRPVKDRRPGKRRFDLQPFTILYVGRVAAEKKIEIIIRAIAKAAPQIPNLGFAIVGRGPDEERLRKIADNLGVAHLVKFLGFLEAESLTAVYGACDAFAIMSTAETQSIVAMNAMAVGLPVMAAAACGLKEYVSKTTGIPIRPGDVEGLAEAILRLNAESKLREALGKAGRKFVEGFAPEAIAGKWEKIYETTIADYNRKHQ